MPSEQSSEAKFEIGHVLFIDIVGYSKLLLAEQKECVRRGAPTDEQDEECARCGIEAIGS